MPGSASIYAIGKVKGSIFMLIGSSDDKFFEITNEGVVHLVSGRALSFAEDYCMPILNNAGFSINAVQIDIQSFNIGDTVPNWSDYTLIQ